MDVKTTIGYPAASGKATENTRGLMAVPVVDPNNSGVDLYEVYSNHEGDSNVSVLTKFEVTYGSKGVESFNRGWSNPPGTAWAKPVRFEGKQSAQDAMQILSTI